MKEPQATDLDRRIQFLRSTSSDDGFQNVEAWANHGLPLWASFQPVSDAERWASGQLQATSMARFVVRYSAFTADLNAKDRLTMDGREFEIVGVKERGRREWLEFTAVSGSD